MEHWHPNPVSSSCRVAGRCSISGPIMGEPINLIGPVRRVGALTSSATPTRTISAAGPRQARRCRVKTPTNIHALLRIPQRGDGDADHELGRLGHRHGPMELYGTEGIALRARPNFFGGTLELAGRDGAIAEEALGIIRSA